MGHGGHVSNRPARQCDLASDLEVLDGLLNTLTDVLDIREVFDRISQLVQRVLPHHILGVGEFSEQSDRMRLYVGAGLAEKPQPFDVPVPDREMLLKPWDATIFEDVQTNPFFFFFPSTNAGMRSVLSAPIRFGCGLRAALRFFSREHGWFLPDDLPVARRVASHIALAMSHQRLAEEARQRQALEAYASKLDLLDQSLASLIDTGELREVIDRISTVTRGVLPHDGLALAVLMPDGRHARRYATSGWDVSGFPELMEVPPDFDSKAVQQGYDIVDDVSMQTEPLNVLVARIGFLSVLRVPIRLEGKVAAGVAFLSRTRSSYRLNDVQAARRIADRLAVRLEREHVVEARKREEEANARAQQLESRVRQLTDELDARTGYRRVIGQSVQWREVLKKAAQVAAVETTVLLLGESGTGKEVVARFVHRGSARRDGPFVALNCAALPDNLLESELFGYERGAFTGAMQSKPGLIEQAAGGILFLDEAGEMALPAQAKFLRVLQEREFQRLGGTRVIRADVRVVAATNRDLRKAIDQKLFREDLYFRLNVFELRLPPLRDRPEDILPLSEAFLLEIGRSIGRPPAGISREAKQVLAEYHWPGNVRELRNILERATILADGGLIVAEHLALVPRPQTQGGTPAVVHHDSHKLVAPQDLESSERAMIEKALQQARFNKSIAAKALGLTRAQLYTRLKRHGLE
jgi:two-component system response regulator AtoC